MKKTLYIVRKEYDGFGGAENVAKRYAETFKEDFDTHLIFAGSEVDRYKFKGTSGPGWFKAISFSNSVNRFLSQQENPLVFSMTRGVPGKVFRMGDGVHNQWLRKNKTGFIKRNINASHLLTPRLEKVSIHNSRWIVSNSEMVNNEVRSEYKVSPTCLKVIHNGYSTGRFQFADNSRRLELKEQKKVNDSDFNLFFCANGWERKGLKHAIRLISKLCLERKCHLWIAGRGDQLFHHRLASNLGVSKSLTFLGSVSDTSIWYQLADLFILPTSYDPFSNSCLEALACGCPVLTTNSNGASECINPSNGLVVKDPESVSSEVALDWINSLHGLSRFKISNSVQKLTSMHETASYINLLRTDD